MDEGQFWVEDDANQDSYLYGDLSNEGIAFIGYRLISGPADRAVEVRFTDGYPRYYFDIAAPGSGVEESGIEAKNLAAIRTWLIDGYGC